MCYVDTLCEGVNDSMKMAYSYLIDNARRLGIITLSGSINDRQLVQIIAELYGGEEWTPGFNTLWDSSNVSELIIEQEGLTDIVDEMNKYLDRAGIGRSALVVTRQLDESMAKILIYMARTESRDRRIFRNREEAEKWLSE